MPDSFQMPKPNVDLNQWPEPLRTSDADSFAEFTFSVRVPETLDETIRRNHFPDNIQQNLLELKDEIADGVVRGLQEDTLDRVFWDEACATFVGRSWFDVVWFWAEVFLYRRILEATTYFQAGDWQGIDPFTPNKDEEWRVDVAPKLLNEILAQLPEDPTTRFRQLLYASLWGNRVDLSYNGAGHLSQSAAVVEDSANLVADDWAKGWEYLQTKQPAHIALIADNAGTEFAMDLALIDFLLHENVAQQLDLYLKPQPFFVSDVMPKDVDLGLTAIAHGGQAASTLADRIRVYRQENRLKIHTHWYFTASLCYYQMPHDLHQALSAYDLVILKGDANYRRLLGDAHWPYTTPFSDIVAYFPTPLIALRTLKSEVVAGLTPSQVQQLQATDPKWLVNGQRGVIQLKV
ncbi:MAG: damage-control phosphatase ARMT1 family protein [Chloroflexota bacterium]